MSFAAEGSRLKAEGCSGSRGRSHASDVVVLSFFTGTEVSRFTRHVKAAAAASDLQPSAFSLQSDKVRR
jgi:hypothetical protein